MAVEEGQRVRVIRQQSGEAAPRPLSEYLSPRRC
jgi:hypothetical protein